jgi:hypothetical protein
VYSTCLFCHKSLGANDAVEHFPVGRRLAFDAAKGRLWAVCRACGRWNLSPLEERWEAIEECERIARRGRRLAASDDVALVDAGGGLTLVRIGAPSWHELADWRYGARLRLRHHWATARDLTLRYLVPYSLTGALLPGFGPLGVLGASAALGLVQGAIFRRRERVPVAFPTDAAGDPATVRRLHLPLARLDPAAAAEGYLRLRLPSDAGPIELEGGEALRVARMVLTRANRDGGARLDVDIALRWVAEAGSGEAYIASIAHRVARSREEVHPLAGTRLEPTNVYSGQLWRLPDLTRLALEVAVSDEAERRALEGELAALERAWREAEEVAAIADSLLLSPAIEARVARLRGEARAPRRDD